MAYLHSPVSIRYVIKSIVKGDVWCSARGGPLAKPGLQLQENDVIVAINRQRLTPETPIEMLLLNTGGSELMLTVRTLVVRE
eukprot:9057270-Pyramimonas_sp.AAC.1